jgi:predicted ATPase
MRKECRFIHDQLSGVQYFRWDPRKLALPVAANVGPVQLSLNGFGLAMLLDDILASDRKRFDEMETKFRDVYPQMGSIRLVRQTAFHEPPDELNQLRQMNQGPGKALFFDTGGRKPLVPAAQMSDGVLLVLAYLAILYSPRPPRLLLIEEPENGIHPKLLQRVIEILREIGNSQWGTQIVLTTHSPYAVDLFKPEEVTLCVKRIDGSIELTRMSESSSVRKQISLFSLGEIWTAEGDESLAKKHDGI